MVHIGIKKSPPKLCAEDNPFIVSTSSDRTNSAARRLIRSHVMRGKNRRKSPSSSMKTGAWLNSGTCSDEELVSAQRECILSGPGLGFFGSGLRLIPFADDMQPYMLDLVFKFFTILMQAMYPIQLCLSVDSRNTVWMEYLQTDTMFLHSQLWLAQTYFDWTQNRPPSRRALLHESKTLHLLRHRVTDPSTATSDQTISVVVTLVNMTALSGHRELARKHMAGLSKMVSVRGGLRALRENTQLQLKVCRADLSTALSTDIPPFLFTAPQISWSPFLPSSPSPLAPPLPNLDAKLLAIYHDLHTFSQSANLAFQSASKLPPELFQEILISTQYRLMLLSFPADGSALELLRLGMLAFSTSVFLQARGIRVRYEALAGWLRDAAAAREEEGRGADLGIWILFMAGISGGEEEDGWILPMLKTEMGNREMREWGVVRALLKRYPWVDALHDEVGKRIFGRVEVVDTA
ncbi:uncharacterized protein LY89DRAFT_106229 [Mollisia scopiformis]|uniref:Uncharacterized protein n=1 Tax=Mollisia scopiformis TaxID=149040 RepID=A0A194X550_MOLSC|nr:uncharacterized protein LY89DRAFT_106229 [Mollisia scopiformis]KUJ15199.1 hypothetical protein LY89DRAFT_106229 [Mollisia scopiformis]